MRDRSIKVTMRANVADFVQNMKSASSATDALTRDLGKAEKVSTTTMGRMAQSMKVHRESWDATGATLLKVGTAITGGVALATKAAMDWESAWAGVKKTVDGTPEQMGALEGSLRELARTLPATHTEIAGVAEAAGQLGIQTGNVASFTKTMIDLGEATNLSADEAATALARFANIMGTSQSKFSNLGSSIVELGNNYATTEREIVEMSTRLASAGRMAGLTEGEVLGLATALSSVGIEAEAGGSAMSKVMIEMRKAVDTGNDKLETFAQTAGMSTAEFKRAFQENAGSAVTAFVEGLGKMDKAGQSVQPILDDLKFTDIRVGNALRSAAAASHLFAGAMETGNKSFIENIALQKEAEQRYATTESRVKVAWNNIKDAAISAGSVLLPVVATVADGVAKLAEAFGALPAPVQGALGVIGLLGGGATLAAGAFLRMAPAVLDTVDHLRKLGAISPGVATKMGNIVATAGKWGPIVGGALAGIGFLMADYQRGVQQAEKLTQAFTDALVANGGAMDESIEKIAALNFVDSGAASAYERMGGNIRDLTDALLEVGPAGDAAKARIKELLEANTTKIKGMRGGALPQMSKDAHLVATETGLAGEAMSEASKKAQQMATMTGKAGDGANKLADGSDNAKASADALNGALEKQAADLNKVYDAMQKAYGITKNRLDAEYDFEAAVRAASEAVKENGKTLDTHTDKGNANWQALTKISDEAWASAKSMVAYGDSTEAVASRMEYMRGKFVEAAVAMGVPKAEAEALADKLGLIPKDIAITAKLNSGKAQETLTELVNEIGGSEGTVKVKGNDLTARSTLADLMAAINVSEEDVKILGDIDPGKTSLADYRKLVRESHENVKIGGDNTTGLASVEGIKRAARQGATVPISVSGLSAARASMMRTLGSPIHVGVTHPDLIPRRADGGPVYKFADGGFARRTGYVTGPGGPRDDLIGALLSNGEFVMKTAAVNYYGLDFMHSVNSMKFADGGAVGGAQSFMPRKFESPQPSVVYRQTVHQTISHAFVRPDSDYASQEAARSRMLVGGAI